MQGSSVSGENHRDGREFDSDRTSDFDVAISDPKIIEKAKKAGIQLRGKGARTGPLKEHDLRKLKLTELADTLSEKSGSDVNFMIYDSE